MHIDETATKIRNMAIEHGWEEEERSLGDWLSLAHSELSEALEAYRDGHSVGEIWYRDDGKPEGVLVELADCVIRLLHHMEYIIETEQLSEISPNSVIYLKMAYNETRPYKHGGKVL